jgi:hypothetical protein
MSSMPTGDEVLIRQLPLPLAQVYRRAKNARTALERHQAAYYCWEAAVKLLGACAVLEYAQRGARDPRLTERLQSLARPSLGHWWEFCRELLPLLADGDAPLGQVREILFGPARTDLPSTATLDGALQTHFKSGSGTPGAVKVQELFNRLIRYRNDEVGHGPLGMRPDQFYADMADVLLAALAELFSRLDVLAGRRLIYVSDVSRDASGDWLVEHFELAGETARKAPPFRVRPGGEAVLPVPKRLYLHQAAEGEAAPAPPRLRTLHPLVIYDERDRKVYFLNAQRGRQHVEYLDYVDAGHLSRDDLAAAQQEFMTSLLGTPVDARALDGWASRAREAEEREEPPRPNPDDPAPRRAPPDGRPALAVRVVLLYKRNAQPDEQLLHRLEVEFTARGAEVFVDRQMQIGVDWAQELERRVRGADAIVPLLSAASVHSEMLAYEVQMAYEESHKRGGKPRLLPVRVQYEDRLPPELSAILDRLQYFLWTGHQDDGRLIAQLLAALSGPAPALKKVPPPSGAVPLDYEFYVTRSTDRDFEEAIARQDTFALIRGVRQMGKTSLLNRGLHQAREAGARVVVTDFQTLDAADLASIEAFYRALGQQIADELDLPVGPGDVWEDHRGPGSNFERYFVREVLEKSDTPLVWGLDEVDRLFTCPFGSEVFGRFRSWHNARDRKPVWKKLTMAIAYATEAHLFITDLNQSPFNVGTLLSLEDFTPDQVGWLNDRYGKPLRADEELKQFYQAVGGHPYLVNRGLYQMAHRSMDWATFHAEAARDDGVFGDHLRRLLVLLAPDAGLTDVTRGVLNKRGSPPPPETFHRLRRAGLLAGESPREARMRCELYARYLGRHLL